MPCSEMIGSQRTHVYIILSCYFSAPLDSHLAIPTHGLKLQIKVVKICLLLIGDFYKEISLDLVVEDAKMF